MNKMQKDMPLLTNSNQIPRKKQRGRRREQNNKAGERPCKKVQHLIASVCQGYAVPAGMAEICQLKLKKGTEGYTSPL